VKLVYADKSIIENNVIDENTGGAGIGIFSSSQTNDIIGNVLIHNAYGVYSNAHYNNVVGNIFVDNISYGVYLNGVANFNVSGNWFGSVAYFQTGIYLGASTARTAITGNSFYQPYRAILGAADANVIGNTISGNSIHLANQEAIYLQAGANQNVIVGNTIRSTAMHAIRIRGSKNVISSNMLIDNLFNL
jgi:parallel beta-helix repeat protein